MTAPADPVLATLTGPGGAFEVVVEDVLGHPIHVYKDRLRRLGAMLESGDARADVEFLVQGERRLTYGEHNALVRHAAARLRALGVGHGDRVAIVSANTVEWVLTFWAAASIGAAAVPLNAWWKTEELEFGLRDSGSRIVVADARRYELLRDLLPTLPALEHVFVSGEEAPEGPALPVGTALFDGAHARGAPSGSSAPAAPGAPEVDEDDLLGILYTSGTTGRPKGATLTHRQALANLQNIFCNAVAGAMRGDAPPELTSTGQAATLLVVPLFHVTGCLATMTLCYATGAKLVLMPPGRFDEEQAMATIERERITAIGGVPTIMWRIVESPAFSRYDLTSVTRASYGGAPAAPELVARIHEAFPNLRSTLSTAYGLTETASVATLNVGDDYRTHPGSVGRVVPTVEIRITGDTGDELPPGSAGEVWLRGPTVMLRGYWNRPDATAESVTDDGWFRTGDIGVLDADGYLTLVDRAKDMIIRAGENVYCVEVETVLFEHPDVVDAAVVGVPHKVLGEEVKAVVQLREGSTVDDDDLRAWCRARLADFKVPAHVERRDRPLPRNPAGKILKSELRGEGSAFAAADDATL